METVNQGTETVNQEQGGTAGEKTFTQAELNAIVQERIGRTKQQYADYEALKEKAGKYDQMQEANKTELEKATGRAAEFEKKYNDLVNANKVRDIRAAVSKETGVPADLLTGSTEEDCKKQAASILAFAKPEEPEKPGYPDIWDAGETKPAGRKSTSDLFGDWFRQNF